MLIILEGNECCFKSTVAEKLSEKLNIPVVKGSSFEFSQCTNKQLFERFKELCELDDVVIDRFIYSNRVYATLYEDFAILNCVQRKHIEELINKKAKVYYLYADSDIIKERISVRGDEYVNLDMVDKINKEYIDTMLDAGINTIAFDTNEWNSDEIAEDIANDFEK